MTKQQLQRREYHLKTRAKALRQMKRWKRENPERFRAAIKRWKQQNPELNAASHKKYNQSIKGRASQAVFRAKKRALMHGVRGPHVTARQFLMICAMYGYLCLRCRRKKKLTLDHVCPLSKGGSNSADNIQPLCSTCNKKKASGTMDYREGARRAA